MLLFIPLEGCDSKTQVSNDGTEIPELSANLTNVFGDEALDIIEKSIPAGFITETPEGPTMRFRGIVLAKSESEITITGMDNKYREFLPEEKILDPLTFPVEQ